MLVRRMNWGCALLAAALLCAAQLSTSPACAATQLIVNGGFETGTFQGWNADVKPTSMGDWYVEAPGDQLPESSNTTSATGAGGAFYAVTDSTGAGAYSLTQTFNVPAGVTSATLSFSMFVNNYSDRRPFNPIPGPVFGPGLEFQEIDQSTGQFFDNQHARVDLLSGGADPFDTSAGVLQNFYLGVDPGAIPHDFTQYSFDITSLVSAGGTFKIRFAEVDNIFFLNLGVDNVSLLVETKPTDVIPEAPSAAIWLALAAAGVAGLTVKRPARV